MKGNTVRRNQSEAYSDIQPPAMFEEKRKRKPRKVSATDAKSKFAAMHEHVEYSRHLAALSR